MKRQKKPAAPAIAPFVDQWGNAAWSNPYGQYRPNPTLAAATAVPVAPVAQSIVINQTATAALPAVVAEPASLTAPVIATVASEAPEVADENRAASIPAQSAPHVHLSIPTTGLVNSIDTASPAYLATRVRYRKALGLDNNETRVGHTPNRAERRRRIHRRLRRGVAVVTAVGAGFVGISAASAYWTAGGSGTGSASTGVLTNVSVAATTGTATTPLYPGSTGDVSLRVTNNNSFAVTLTSVTGGPGPSSVTGPPGCTVPLSGVTFNNQNGLNVTIPGSATTTVDLAGAASMSLTSANGCQGQTFTFAVTVTVKK